ncbi:MAG: hypothetical protein ACPLRA_05780, partial [Candidatus Saccharicenans sp.]
MLDLLSSDGLIAALFYYLPPPRQELRFLGLWVETLEKLGYQPETHLLSLRSVETVAFFIKKKPFSEEELEGWRKFASERFYDLSIPGLKGISETTSFIKAEHFG